MPPIIAALFFLIGIGAGSSMTTRPAQVWKGVDPTVPGKPHRGECAYIGRELAWRPGPACYDAWSSTPWVVVSKVVRDRHVCEFRMFAVVQGGFKTRMSIGRELRDGVDWSWSYDVSLPEGRQITVPFNFLDPEVERVLTTRTVVVSCVAGYER